jgi:hypothetical protein
MPEIHGIVLDLLTNWGALLAQKIEDPQIMDQIQENFNYFIESGQVWALGVGFVLGYLFRNFTAY